MKKIKYLFLLFSFSTPFFVLAESTVTLSDSVLLIEGECSKTVTVALQKEGKMLYSAGATCENGQYNFKDDLRVWGIPEKSYELWVDGKLVTNDFVYVIEKERKRPLTSLGSETNILSEGIPAENSPETITATTATEQLRDGLQKIDFALQLLEQKSNDENQEDGLKSNFVAFMREAFTVLNSFFADFEKSDTEIQIPDEGESISAPLEEKSPVSDAQEEQRNAPVSNENMLPDREAQDAGDIQ